MSLLIKALDKAENDKVEIDKVEHSGNKKPVEKNNTKDSTKPDLALSLSPTGSSLTDAGSRNSGAKDEQNSIRTSSISTPTTASTASPKSAANVFSAKGVEASNRNASLALIAGAGLIALLGIGLYFYQLMDTAPELVMPPRPPLAQADVLLPKPTTNNNTIAALTEIETSAAPEQIAEPQQVFKPAEAMQLAENQVMPVKGKAKKSVIVEDEEFAASDNTVEADEPAISKKANKKSGQSKTIQLGEAIASPSASINVSKSKPEASINPILMRAYDAYNAGNDVDAQKLYKQVLQQDVHNVDALLGLGAIASRQGRVADANGWYGKVLEVDPRNSMAQTALLDTQLQTSQVQGNDANNEPHIKAMLAKHPNDANLHVTLGNFYAEQNQWSSAQQAYFDAYRLNVSADNAFNLAVSLDQMGKSKLALPYYQRALELMQSGANGIDKTVLEARQFNK
jgi:tetratricopeptide (TPR) repeat protein